MVLYGPAGKGFEGADEPIPLSQGMREFGVYDQLDESSMHEDPLGKVLGGSAPRQEHAPDDIVLQLGNDGELYGKNVNHEQENYGYQNGGMNAYANRSNPGNKSPEDKKYPYEENEEL